MKHSLLVVGLAWVIVLLALVAVGAGFFWPNDGGASFSFTTVRGEPVTIYGHGLYRYDTRFVGAGNHGSDVVTLVLGIPLLTYATVRYRRGSLRGGLLLLGTLVYFLYLYSSYALGTAFNPLFLVYIAIFSASLFAVVQLFAALAGQFRMDQLAPDLPRRGIAVFMVFSGLATLVIWLQPLLNELAHNQLPAMLGAYSTKVTDVLDLGLITPATLTAGLLIWRRNPVGYLIAFSLLVLEIMLTPLIVAQTVSQLGTGIYFTPAEIIGPMVGFATLGLLALWVMIVLWRKTTETTYPPVAPFQPARTLLTKPSGTTIVLLLFGLLLVYGLAVQPWFMRWGATDAEIAMPLPGDPFIPPTTVVSTRAITIHAPVAQVWPWIVQLGQQHAGFYSYDRLENLFAARMHNADQIVPEWQGTKVGDPVFMMADPPPMSVAEIVLLEPEQMMVLKGGWAFYLQPVDAQTTRFIVRYASFPVKGNWAAALYYYPMFEPAHFVMEAGMMIGIKARAEAMTTDVARALPKGEVVP